MNAWDHAMVGIGSEWRSGDRGANDALEKLEKQILKLRAKWRDTKRYKDKEAEAAPASPSCAGGLKCKESQSHGRGAKGSAPARSRAARKSFASIIATAASP